MVNANAKTGGHKDDEIKEKQPRGLALDRQRADEATHEELPEGQGQGQMSGYNGEKLPDRKRFDQRSDLPTVKRQHHQHEKRVQQDPSHFRLLAHGGITGQLAWAWNRIHA